MSAIIDRYRLWYQWERDATSHMLAMLDSVPQGARKDARFTRALMLANHLAACRENWLDRMDGNAQSQVEWFEGAPDVAFVRDRHSAIEAKWTEYLARLTDQTLVETFDYISSDGRHWSWVIEGQVFQLVGHACYHRGQIVQLVDELGGETVDTDYLFWSPELVAQVNHASPS